MTDYEVLLDKDMDIHMEECAECRAAVGLTEKFDERQKLDAIREERGSRYGDVRINHSSIGAIWGGILLQAMSSKRWQIGEAVPPELVCLMMVGVKLSREAYRHTGDNIDDAINYLDFTEELS